MRGVATTGVLSLVMGCFRMRIALLANADSVHTIKWANGLASRGLEIHLISAHRTNYLFNEGVTLYSLPVDAPFGYVASLFSLRKLLAEIQPNVLHAHYATGYGLLLRLSGYKPLMLSVWGSDVYDFPNKSFVHKRLVQENMKVASVLGSTSHCMARQAKRVYDHARIRVTPFGVDEETFRPVKVREGDVIVIGAVKALSHKYGIDTLIEAFAMVVKALSGREKVALEVTGGGEEEADLRDLVRSLGIETLVTFYGPVPHASVPDMINRLDIYVALSRLESFGVAIIEASACAKPVVVSDADGPAEVVINGVTGFIVPRNDPAAAAKALLKLVHSPELREHMGRLGRAHVIENYTWNQSLDIMISVYEEMCI